MLRNTRGSLAVEMAIVAGACIVVMVIMSNVCLFLIRAGQFDRISAEVARSCAYAEAPYSAQEGIEHAMGLVPGGAFSIQGTASGGGPLATQVINFELEYHPFIEHITIGQLSISTPTFRRSKTYAVPSIGYSE
ncbi:MAG: hypothetical protein FWD41_03665 [Actinomycetia bacterium]|nr:hypothetical protein [Actinomycetes bacterium]